MKKPQQSISLNIGSEWKIRRPNIYRYLNKEHVDSFFETGDLRLSSFDVFSEHEDEQRFDDSEGQGTVVNRTSEGKGQTISAFMSQGQKGYVLCGSMSYNNELAEDFGTDSGFRIDNIVGFGHAVSRFVPGFIFGLEGPCIYLDSKILDRDLGQIDINSLRTSTDFKNIDVNKLKNVVSRIAGDDLYFVKDKKFAHQNEYRLIWQKSQEVKSFLNIQCTEAIQFCTRFEDIDFGG